MTPIITPPPGYQFQMPTRLRILKALTAALEEISPALDYVTDLRPVNGRKVFRGRILYGQNDPVPMVSILETPLQVDPSPGPNDARDRKSLYELTIQGWAEDDADDPSDPAHYLAADVIRRLAVEKEKNKDFNLFGMGDDVTDIIIGQQVVRPPDDISEMAYFYVPVFLELAEDLTKPYGNKVS